MLNRKQFTLLKKLYDEQVLKVVDDNDDFDHKANYSSFSQMYPYVEWVLGMAFITDKGKDYIERTYWD